MLLSVHTKIARRSAAALTLAALAITQPALAAAAGASPLPEGTALAPAPLTQTGSHSLVTTYSDFAPSTNAALVAGFNTVDTLVVKCGNEAGCTFGAEAFAQISPPAGTLWAVCVSVDGVYINPGCPYQGTLPQAGTYVSGSYRGTAAVVKGKHTVKLDVYASAASVLGEWAMDVRVYKP